MFPLMPLLRSQGSSSSTGVERFIERLEARCHLSAAPVAHPKLIPLDYYAGAGTIVNAFSPNAALTVTSAASPAPALPPSPPNVAGLEPAITANILPTTTPGGVSNVDLIVNSSSAAAVTQGPTASTFADQTLGSVFSASPGASAPQFPLSGDFMSILSAGLSGSGGGLVSVFAER